MTIEERAEELREALEDVHKAGSVPINTDNHAWVVAKSIKLDRAEMRAKNLSYEYMPAILDALAAKDLEIERLRAWLMRRAGASSWQEWMDELPDVTERAPVDWLMDQRRQIERLHESLAWAGVSLLGYEQSHGTGRGDEEAYDIAALLGYEDERVPEAVQEWLCSYAQALNPSKEGGRE